MLEQSKKPMKTFSDQKPDISIIIINYQSERYLENNLVSVYGKIFPEVRCEIIIINNDRKENLELIKNRFPEIKIAGRGRNIGFGAAGNLGAKAAQGRFLFFLNPDCEIVSQNILEIINEFDKDKNIGIMGSQLVRKNGKAQKWICGKEMSLSNLIRNNLGFSRSRKIWESRKKIKTDWVAGTAMIIRKIFFEELGGFDEKFFMYFEDMDLCRRIRKAGKKVIYFPNFKVKHLEGGSFAGKKFQKSLYYDSQEYFFKKHRSKPEYFLVKLIRKLFHV